MPARRVFTTNTTLLAVIVALVIVVVGIGLLFWADAIDTWPKSQAVMRDIGALLFVSVAIGAAWELVLKRVFLDEILAKAELATDVKNAGLAAITMDFGQGVNWVRLLEHARELDIYFAYGRTWRNTYGQQLREMAQRSRTKMRVILPDPDIESLMSNLGARFGKSVEEMKTVIQEATSDFQDFCDGTDAKLEIWYTSCTPVFSFYRIDHVAILATYKHESGRGRILTITVEEGGSLYNFIRDEFRYLKNEDKESRKIVSAN